jgi:hypothetical protein
MKARPSLPLIVLLVVGCSAGSEGMAGSESAATVATRSQPASASAPRAQLASAPVVATRREVIRRAELAVRVPDVEKAEREVNRQVESWQGYVESASSTDLATDRPSLTMALRVPVGRFEECIAKLEGLGVRLSKTVSSEDVTAQIVDFDARLQTLRAQEETYRNLLRRAGNLDNVVTLQDKLTEVRSTIESMAAQRKAMAGLAALSTVSLRLEQDAIPHAPAQDPNWMAQTWGEATTTLSHVVRTLANLGVYLLVFSPFWIPFALLFRKMLRPSRPAVPPPPVH